MTTKFFALTLMLAATMAVAACENTWHGAGKDVEAAGEAMQ